MPTWVVIVLILAIVTFAIYSIIMEKGSKRQKEARKKKMYTAIYRFLMYSNFSPFTAPFLRQIYTKLANLSIYRKDEIQVLSAQYFLVSVSVGAVLFGYSALIYSDVITVLICLMFAMLLINIIVDKRLDSMYLKVLKATAILLSGVRQEYMRTGSVVEAVTDVDVPILLKKPLSEIEQMLTGINGQLKLQEFTESTPFRTLQTFAVICYEINNQGDEVDAHGQSNFIQALTLLLNDVNSDIFKVTKRKQVFGIIEYLPFIPILAMKPAEQYFTGIMPGTALIYEGTLGYVMKTITILLAVIAYTVVSRVNTTIPYKEDDRSPYITTLLENRLFRGFIQNIKPVNRGRVKLEMTLRHSLSKMSIEHFYAKKVIFSVVGFSVILIMLASATSLGRDFAINSTQSLSLIATDEMDGYTKDQILALDRKYLEDPERYNEVEATNLVKAHMSGLTDLQVQDQVKRLETKAKTIKGAYFKWWYIIVAYVGGVAGFFFPNMGLVMRKTLIQTEEEEDFIQLQTLVSILMNTNIDTLDLLEQLANNSRVHKDMFLYAYHCYVSNPELELERLQSKTSILEFKRFIAKMKLSISDLSLKEAYSDLLIEREYILKMRDMTIESSLASKRGMCGPLAMSPLGAMILTSFLVPIGYLGINEFMNAMTAMG